MASFVPTLALAAAAAAAPTGPTCAPIDKPGVAALFDQWNLALSSLDADKVAERYWPDALLLAPGSNQPRTTPAMIRNYYAQLLGDRPRGRIDSRSIQLGCNLAIDAGTYTLSVMNAAGVVTEVPGRYTYVYQFRDGAWKIIHQHGSGMPETVVANTAPGAAAALAADGAGAKPAVPGAGATATVTGRKGRRGAKAGADAPAETARISASLMFLNKNASPQPAEFYPAEARAKKERGTVQVRVCANPAGALVGTPEVLETSGSPRLDGAAQAWARAAKWVPATENGAAVEGCAQLGVQFGS